MREERALELANHIVSAIPGWSEDATIELIHEIECWGDEYVAEAAVMTLCRSWTDSHRPTLGEVVELDDLAQRRPVRIGP